MLTFRPPSRSVRSHISRPGVLFIALLLTGAAVTAGCGREVITPDEISTSSAATESRATTAEDALESLRRVLTGGAPIDTLADLASGTAIAALRGAAGNVERLGIEALSLRLVDVRPDSDPDRWRAVVALSYRLARWESAPTAVDVSLQFEDTPNGARIIAVGGPDSRTPVWWRGPVTLATGPRWVVISRKPDPERLARLAELALADVGLTLPRWQGQLIIEEPATPQELDEALDAEPGEYSSIAAVTAAIDGGTAAPSPVHILVNPGVFDGLGARGSRLVISHEATHVATEATFSTMPIWMLEGFADYVAIKAGRIDVARAGAQYLAQVRQDGPPTRLPTPEDLAPTATGIGATYEAAWLAVRFLAERYGERALLAAYQQLDQGRSVAMVFQDILGITEAQFVDDWAAAMSVLAKQVSR